MGIHVPIRRCLFVTVCPPILPHHRALYWLTYTCESGKKYLNIRCDRGPTRYCCAKYGNNYGVLHASQTQMFGIHMPSLLSLLFKAWLWHDLTPGNTHRYVYYLHHFICIPYHLHQRQSHINGYISRITNIVHNTVWQINRICFWSNFFLSNWANSQTFSKLKNSFNGAHVTQLAILTILTTVGFLLHHIINLIVIFSCYISNRILSYVPQSSNRDMCEIFVFVWSFVAVSFFMWIIVL